MTINGVNISTFGATQSRILIGHHDWKHDSQWVPGAVKPVYGVASVSEKSLEVVLNIKGTSRSDIIEKRSNLLAALTGEVDLVLDGYPHMFHGCLSSHKEDEKVRWRWHQLALSFDCYEYGTAVSGETTNASSTPLVITNPGNMVSPCRVEITPRVGAASITLTGLCRDSFTGADLPVVIPTLTTGKTVVIDGKTGMITEDGALKDMTIWALPSMKPGANSITCNSSAMTVKVITTPFYE